MDRDQGPNEGTEDEAADQQAMHDILLTDADGGEGGEEQPQQPDRTDWKARAIELETRMRMENERRQVEQQPQQPVVDDIARINAEIAELESQMPTETKDEAAFWKRIELQDKLSKKTRELSQAVHQANQNRFTEMASGTAVQQFKARFASDPTFKQIEGQFDQWVQQMEPNLRANPGMLEMLRKNLAYDWMVKNGGRVPAKNTPRGAPAAPSGAHAPEQQRQQQAQKSSVKFKSEAEAKVAEFYGMTADEYYGPRYNEVGPDTEGNGIQIMDLPTNTRRARRG